ncbi:MAG: hypothetical protein HXS54_02970 [Theionarchaea archaeon]|nr:hypothetical protein [Theionarchaea archaeon]
MNVKIKLLSLIISLLFILSIGRTHEFSITTDPSSQGDPAIFGTTIVWTDWRNGNMDIYGYNLSTKEEFQITTDPHDQCCPEIYKDTVIWVDERNGNRDIYGFNLQTKKEFQVIVDQYEQWYPAIFEDTVIYVDLRDDVYSIYSYSLSTSRKTHLVTYMSTSWFEYMRPAIYGDFVVWVDTVHLPGNVTLENLLCCNCSTLEVYPVITSEGGSRWNPAINGNTIVWSEGSYDGFDIYEYNLLTSEMVQITSDSGDQFFPAIYENIVVWDNTEDNEKDIHGYNMVTKEEILITANPGIQSLPAIYEDTVVWIDKRNGNYDIYGYNLSKTYIGFHFTWIDALIFFIVITGITLFLRRTQIKESLNRKTMTRLLVSMGVSLILVVIGYLGLRQGSSLFGLAQITNFFMIMFYRVFFQNPLYEKIGYFVTFLFWTGISYVIIKLWRD